MIDYGSRGWIFSLKEGSNWGEINSFYSNMFEDAEQIDDQVYLIKSDVWGKISTKSFRPQMNDGIAFYHSSGAKYSSIDYYEKKRRISLLGKIVNVKYDKRGIRYLEFLVDKEHARLLRLFPIIRESETEKIFQEAGLVQYNVASLYYSAEQNWDNLVNYFKEHIISSSYSDAITNIIEYSTKANDFKSFLKIADDLRLVGEYERSVSFLKKIIEGRNDLVNTIDFNKLFFSLNEFYNQEIKCEVVNQLIDNCNQFVYELSKVIELLVVIVKTDTINLISHNKIKKLFRIIFEEPEFSNEYHIANILCIIKYLSSKDYFSSEELKLYQIDIKNRMDSFEHYKILFENDLFKEVFSLEDKNYLLLEWKKYASTLEQIILLEFESPKIGERIESILQHFKMEKNNTNKFAALDFLLHKKEYKIVKEIINSIEIEIVPQNLSQELKICKIYLMLDEISKTKKRMDLLFTGTFEFDNPHIPIPFIIDFIEIFKYCTETNLELSEYFNKKMIKSIIEKCLFPFNSEYYLAKMSYSISWEILVLTESLSIDCGDKSNKNLNLFVQVIKELKLQMKRKFKSFESSVEWNESLFYEAIRELSNKCSDNSKE